MDKNRLGSVLSPLFPWQPTCDKAGWRIYGKVRAEEIVKVMNALRRALGTEDHTTRVKIIKGRGTDDLEEDSIDLLLERLDSKKSKGF